MTLPLIADRPYVLLPGEPMRCPAGHHADKHVWVGGPHPNLVQRCQHREPRTSSTMLPSGQKPAPCNLCWWWVLIPGGLMICAPTTSSDAHKIETGAFDLLQILELVGLRAPWQITPGRELPPRAKH